MKAFFLFLMNVLRMPLDFLDYLIEERRLVRRLLVVWAVGLITTVTYDILDLVKKMDEVTTPVVSFYLGVTALLTAVIGLYQFLRQRDDEREEKRRAQRDTAQTGRD